MSEEGEPWEQEGEKMEEKSQNVGLIWAEQTVFSVVTTV